MVISQSKQSILRICLMVALIVALVDGAHLRGTKENDEAVSIDEDKGDERELQVNLDGNFIKGNFAGQGGQSLNQFPVVPNPNLRPRCRWNELRCRWNNWQFDPFRPSRRQPVVVNRDPLIDQLGFQPIRGVQPVAGFDQPVSYVRSNFRPVPNPFAQPAGFGQPTNSFGNLIGGFNQPARGSFARQPGAYAATIYRAPVQANYGPVPAQAFAGGGGGGDGGFWPNWSF